MTQTQGGTVTDSDFLEKCPTGIKGLDEITEGGLPRGRPSLVCGGPGCGKTMLAMEFLVRGARNYDEPGVFVTFDETARDLTKNVASLGFNLGDLVSRKKILLSQIPVQGGEIEEVGQYTLDGLFIRIKHGIDSIGARRVVLDGIESLFSVLTNESLLRSEIRRLFLWLKEVGVTMVITGERGTQTLTRHGLEEYIADCVILLDHRVTDEICTRRMRIVKYRGSAHAANESPFVVDRDGIYVFPITSLGLDHEVSSQRILTGIEKLDTMLEGKGYFGGSSLLVSGSAGTGKTSIAAHFVDVACQSGQRGLFVGFEESRSQILRNMKSIGIDLGGWIAKDLLRFHTDRPTSHGLEMHLLTIFRLIDEFHPNIVVIDPISSLTAVGSSGEARAMVTRLIDFVKMLGITGVYTDLTLGGAPIEQTEIGISSLMDVWILLQQVQGSGRRDRTMSILKARGIAHSNQIRGYLITDKGVRLEEV